MTNRQWYLCECLKAEDLRDQASRLMADADSIEVAAEKFLGLLCVPGEPGFPCWTHKDLGTFLQTADEVLEVLERNQRNSLATTSGSG